ncbi:MAG: ATP-binding protein [Proteobacteria bacterium]|nr:ATP-binding protein [Pseudomonadota bacterium]
MPTVKPPALFDRPLRAAVAVALADTPVVCLMGPRQAGKTTLARQFEPAFGYVTLDDPATLAFAQIDPSGFVDALPDPVILDEVQRAPELLRAIKLAVDRDRRPGRFLLTGSANLLLLPRLGDSLAGRMEVVDLQPLTAAEQARRPGRFLDALLEGKLKPALTAGVEPGMIGLAAQVVAGGFPEAVRRDPARARAWHRQYLRAVLDRDVHDVARVRDTRELARLLELFSLRTAQLLNIASLGNELDMRRETIEHYFSVCERLFMVRRLNAWHTNRAKRLIKAPKVHLVDSGLAATLAGMTVDDATVQRERFGHLLETFVVQQLMAQAGWIAPELEFSHYRDKDQVEVDLVINRGREVWGVEVKSAATVTPADGAGLRRLADRCGKHFRGGVVLHAGTSTIKLAVENCLGVPLARLWDM